MCKLFYCLFILAILVGGVNSLVRCRNVTEAVEVSRFPPVSVICDRIDLESFIESFGYFITTDFTAETCNFSQLTKIYISPRIVIASEQKTVYRRGPEEHSIRLSCVPEGAEYLTGGMYLLIKSLPYKQNAFKLNKEYRDEVCNHLLDEASFLSSEGSEQEVVKFIRRITSSEGITGAFIKGRINYIYCDIIDLPVVKKSIIESECFNGTIVETNDGQSWYTSNGLDIVSENDVKACLQSVPYSVLMSLEKENILKNGKVKEGQHNTTVGRSVTTEAYNVFMSKKKFNMLFEALSSFNSIELLFMLLALSFIYAAIWFCMCGCLTCCYYNREKKKYNASFVSSV
uniref:Glycoprotein n=1 Tax=Strongyloides stercoralis TaxID=6248 RepID=A0A0K0E6H2_STRER